MTDAGAREYVTVVSGLPRSGTSLAMQMLQAGGLEALADEVRKADEDNLRGYWEFEPVKQTKKDPSWVNSAAGKAVKMVYRLLYDLPAGYDYRVIFMKRKLAEVLASQRTMLDRKGAEGAKLDDAQLARVFESQVARCEAWLDEQANFEVLKLDYNELIADPRPQVEQLAAFLGGLDVQAMLGVIDPSLYHQRR